MTDQASWPDVDEARAQLVDLHLSLVDNGLVAWTSGNVSARARDGHGQEVFVIKPSGVDYAELTAQRMVVCDLDGAVVAGGLSPSSDTAAHAYVYRHRPDVGGVVHTHSPYACAWAARHEPIPCVLSAMADAPEPLNNRPAGRSGLSGRGPFGPLRCRADGRAGARRRGPGPRRPR
nr:class II aldolase/adducin family protein [Pseudofrankia asymbiotica]